ncbi:MAG: hypothetical protein OXK77_01625 [Gemmatimonadota bacterium]|nr:hypothetical protein [Gemmatimonadota bacterium]MDE2781631.1 hypothetical protein [Gemmatimonadota bacterium]MDE2864203.1 hypothetical protein [Gemmatimonadota bacterium]MXV94587.1 hypothetical protein [Gemmatimonadota bacterium]MXX71302.1 hypothetical protein [Gemmatimonadota bacterium]
MSSAITVRRINPGDKAWLKDEARRAGLSMEEFVRRLISEKRESSRARLKPSETFKRYFGPENGVESISRGSYGYRPVEFRDEE